MFRSGDWPIRIGFNKKTSKLAAIKILSKRVKISDNKDSSLAVERSFGAIEDKENMYFAMEFAASGELFDRIEPDVGLEINLVHLYFKQLISGVAYLHQNGIAHRELDLKPEVYTEKKNKTNLKILLKTQNMLLDEDANLKISDFGLSTKFTDKNNAIRVLVTACGTPPYVAPEIYKYKYFGHEVDIWSCGVILYVMLMGNTLWAEPTENDPEYVDYYNNYNNVQKKPWKNLPKDISALLVGMLNPHPSARLSLNQILNNNWFSKPNKFLSTEGNCNDPAEIAGLMLQNFKLEETAEPQHFISFSQPQEMRFNMENDFDISQPKRTIFSFSQPQNIPDQNSLSPVEQLQDNFSVALSQCREKFLDFLPSDKLTRFYSKFSAKEILKVISEVLVELVVPYKASVNAQRLQFQTVDKRMCPIHGEINVQIIASLEANVVVFKRNKGDPIEFTRFYRIILSQISNIILK
ncbi:Chk1 protein kinase [Clydaea vesicula]|uniref:non-specific serine/threonine protein kinase n=1 Tax=Clydaea vesicula TaxID=447962 RepID=A0AAD5XVB5_9FUNG|nr:Chk1 protein kinase [Clydaea vesicula]